MNEFFKRIKNQFTTIWKNLTKIQKITIFFLLGSLLTFLILFFVLSSKVNYEPLFTELESKDAAKIKASLDKRGITYRITGNGTVIEVPKEQKYAIRLDLSKEGVLPDSAVGFEIFDNSKIGATEFDKQMMFLRAQKGELEKTIKSLSQVKRAVVNITPANNSPFANEKTEAKASVLIELESFETLKEENIKSIIVLVAGAIENLPKENVEVVDTSGNILSDMVDFSQEGSLASRKRIELQQEIEKKLERSANGVLNVLGGGNYRVKVSVELDFNKESYQTESYTTPTVSGEQLTQGLIRSEQNNLKEVSGGVNDVASGVPGTTSNIPGYVGKEESNSSNYKENNVVKNYELDKKNTVYEKSIGNIKRMTVSVTLNKDSVYFKDKENITPAEITQFENMVKTAVGFNENRGDKINVTVLPFNFEIAKRYNDSIAEEQKWKKYQLIGIYFIIITLIIAGGALLLFKRLESKRIKEREEKAIADLLPQLDDVNLNEEAMSIEEQERADQENQIRQIAIQKPEEVANLLRNWLMED
ncbi:flagellar M-ring protein FliF [Hypnocyclicus thermotrophus]|uniref:Flagellar M-ring protein n=1 Tax=Hypnocyclicus thermotrophus TaxID=1627895 RepID=A0AA46DY71_9FUSO|nr:flagellar basal-body MS-ring/collar protein FliF [Hypnocyclicus thermotrophus]TDT69140.1 flagellar M-ring protein FliF [Hypnocyclicus thermotrophus]